MRTSNPIAYLAAAAFSTAFVAALAALDSRSSLLLLPPVLWAAYMGGLRTGLLASAITVIGAVVFVTPPHTPDDVIHVVGLAGLGLLVSALFEACRFVPQSQPAPVAQPPFATPTSPAPRPSVRALSVADRSLAVAVHDLNNLLGVISANASLLAETLPAEHEDHELVEEIEAAITRASLVTKQLAQMAREQPVERPSQAKIDPAAITQRVQTLRELEPIRA